jgi:hypothetical protein
VHIRRILPLLAALALTVGLVVFPFAPRMTANAGGLPIDYSPRSGPAVSNAVSEPSVEGTLVTLRGTLVIGRQCRTGVNMMNETSVAGRG